jgi:hypothetical protein
MRGNVIPAKASTSGRAVTAGLPEAPAFAGVTVAGLAEATALGGGSAA